MAYTRNKGSAMIDQPCIDWLSIGPELHLRFSAPFDFTLSAERRMACKQNISKLAVKVFEKRFGIQSAIPVSIDEKSIRIRVRPKLEILPYLLGVYKDQYTDRYLAADIGWCWQRLAPVVKKVMTAENPAIKAVEIEQIQGALERLDALSFACENKGQWEDADLAEAKSNLSIIYSSRTRDALVPAMNAYFEIKYPSDGDQNQTNASDTPPFNFLSDILMEEQRRRQNGLSNKIGVRSAIE